MVVVNADMSPKKIILIGIGAIICFAYILHIAFSNMSISQLFFVIKMGYIVAGLCVIGNLIIDLYEYMDGRDE